ncbi:MAG: bifunctional demethylmenaquinone methyltransferase/2-methoxy-6-polyprenyl-1,4-benzoquinol methylase UbiE [Cyanobacteria bacterium P01_A01_bin.135]
MTPPPSPAQVQALFDQIAPQYDALNTRLSFGLHHVWKQMAVDWAGPMPGATCLDICCGSGDLAYLLARRAGPTGQVTGVDFAPRQLAIARQRAATRWAVPRAEITWVTGDALDLPVDSGSIDAATMGYGLRNVANIPKSLAEIRRVLRPSARAAILDFHRPKSLAVRQFQQLYLDNWVVPTARQFGLASEYAYISDSLRRFPTGDRQVELARGAGFASAVHHPLMGGMMGVLVVKA